MLCVKGSSLAPRRVYRALRSGKTRYDTELDKGWRDYIHNVAPIQTVDSPSPTSATGTIMTISGEGLDDVDVSSLSRIRSTLRMLMANRSSYLRLDSSSDLSSVTPMTLLSIKHHCLKRPPCPLGLGDHHAA